MKLKSILFMLIAAFTMMACSDDETANELPGAADKVAGTYKGEAKMVVGSSELPATFDVVLAKKDANTVAVKLEGDPNSQDKMSIKNLVVEDVKVAENSGAFTLSKEIGEEGIKAQDGDMVWTISNVSGSIADNALQLTVVGKPGSMPMPINITFTGKK